MSPSQGSFVLMVRSAHGSVALRASPAGVLQMAAALPGPPFALVLLRSTTMPLEVQPLFPPFGPAYVHCAWMACPVVPSHSPPFGWVGSWHEMSQPLENQKQAVEAHGVSS